MKLSLYRSSVGFWVTAWATAPGHGFRREDGNEKDARVSEQPTPGNKAKTKINLAAGHIEREFFKQDCFPSDFLDL